MKKIYLCLLFYSVLTVTAQTTKTVGSGGDYSTLKGAFDAINSGSITGIVTLQIISSTTETASAVLYQSGYGGVSSYTSVNIYPTQTGLTISGNIAAPLIDLNGADSVTIDGRVNQNTSPKSLTISNTHANAGIESSTLRFINEATKNIVKYCNIQGSETYNASGVIYFATTNTTRGNKYILIDNNDITNAGIRPVNAIYSFGSSGTAINDTIIISNNNIYDILNTSLSPSCISLNSNTSVCTISGNSFYETTTLTSPYGWSIININNTNGSDYTVTNNYIGGKSPLCGTAGSPWTSSSGILSVIYLNVGTATTSTIQGNTIKNFDCTISNSGVILSGINVMGGNVNVGTNTGGNSIGDNTTTGSIKLTNTTTGITVYFIGVNIVSSGTVNCERNTIGSITATNVTDFSCIYKRSSSGNVTINNNFIGSASLIGGNSSIEAGSTVATDALTLIGIRSEGIGTTNITNNTVSFLKNKSLNTNNSGLINGVTATAGTNTITGNTINDLTIANANTSATNTASAAGIAHSTTTLIGTITGNSVYNISNTYNSFTGNVYGIYFSGGAVNNNLSTNNVYNISASATTAATVTGIYFSNAISTNTVSENTIYNLSTPNTAAAQAANIIGLSFGAGTGGTNTISRNFIRDLSIGSSSTTGVLYGIKIVAGASTYFNNIISMGGSTTTTLYGIYETGAATNNNSLYHNTVYIQGTTAGTLNSYALFSAANTNTRIFKDNILVNTRSRTGASGSHYAIRTTSGGSLTIDYNDYLVNTNAGSGGVLGYYNADRTTFAAWQANVIGGDPFSKNADPQFNSNGSGLYTPTQPLYYTPSYKKLPGLLISGISTDYFNNPRPPSGSLPGSVPFMGAIETDLSFPVEVWQGTKKGNYVDLGSAFSNFNNGTHNTGNFDIKILDNTNESVSAVLNASGSGSASYTAIHIYPTSTGLSVNGNLAAPLIDLNGADSVTFDGRVNQTGSKDLIISNTNASNTAGTSTIRFINDAQNNIVKYCTIKGSEAYYWSGVVFFSTTTLSNGNDGNLITDNDITNAGTRPVNAVFSFGTAAKTNDNDTIRNNNIYNFLNVARTSSGIFLYSNTSIWNISGNSFYESTSLAPSTDSAFYAVRIINTAGNNFTINNNYIGGATALCGGITNSKWIKGGGTTPNGNNFFGIYLNVGTATASTLQFNIIKNFDFSNTTFASWRGIGVFGGNVNVGTSTGGNCIGDLTTTGSIRLTNNSTSGNAAGIILNGTAGTITGSCEKDTVCSITAAIGNPANLTLVNSIYGIYTTACTNVTIKNNLIGSTTIANSINATQANTSNTQLVYGIFTQSTTGSNTITGNTIANLNNNSNAATGIVGGVYYSGPTVGTNTVSGNFINSLTANSNSLIYGFQLAAGATTYSNNIISLSGNTKNNKIYGIYETGAAGNNNSLYHNTVYIGGTTPASSTLSSYALYSAVTTNTRNFRNNIFSNNRSNGSSATGNHFALYILTSGGTITADYNDYQASGTGGVLGYYGANKTVLPIVTGQDVNSLNSIPSFANAGGTNATDYNVSNNSLVGVSGTGIATDYGGTTRASVPTMGTFENPNLVLYVEVWMSGVLQASYLSLKSAFDKINDGTHTGTLDLRINHSTIETSSAVLNASGSGSASYSAIHIYPTATGLSITGNLTAPLIDLNGADSVTIDGRVNQMGGKDLIITNTSASISGGTSTIRFINEATKNIIKYCTVKGAETSTTSGIIYVATTNTTRGNKYILIDNNNITNAGTRPINAVYSSGTATYINDSITISNNNIYDFLSLSTASNAVNLSSNTSVSTISGNSFYETSASFVPTAIATFNVIQINNSSGNNFIITNNYIGGRSPSCGGLAWTKTNAFDNVFYAINLSVGTTTTSNIQGNTIQNFSWSNSSTSGFYGILVSAGAVNIGTTSGNTIGSGSGTGSIVYTGGATGAALYGISITSSGTVNCQNNVIGSITCAASAATNATHFYGINNTGNSTISGNTIGSTSTSNSVNATSVSSGNAQNVYGIYSAGSGTISISGNTIANLTNGTTNSTAATTGMISGIYSTLGTNTISDNTIYSLTNANANTTTTNTASVTGIALSATSAANTVSGNTIHHLSNTYASFAGSVYGIYFTGSTGANACYNNFIYSLTITGATSTTGSITGIRAASGVTTYYNNIITLGGNTTTTLYGIYEVGTALQTCSIYHNSIYLNGSVGSGTNKSYCIYSAANSNTRSFVNNILFNARSTTGGSNLHYAIGYNYGANTNLTVNNNDYYVTGTGGTLAYYNASNITTLSGLRTAIGNNQDIFSVNQNPQFALDGGTNATDYLPSYTGLYGLPIGILTDYLNITRKVPPTIGAFEITLPSVVEVWKSGAKQADYNTLKDAFNAVNSGVHNGDLDIKIVNNVFESATAVLYQSGYGGVSNYSSIHIYPTITGLTIYGNFIDPLIDLNGADNVIIDGRLNGTGNLKDLTIVNVYNSTTNPSSTIRFVNDAENNLVEYCNLKGAGSSVVLFYSTTGTDGNDNNVVDNNNITGASDVNRPYYAISSFGTDFSRMNGNITISNNNIFNILSKVGNNSYGIYLSQYTEKCTINGNSFYETTTYTPVGSSWCAMIYIWGGGGEFTINGNFIGGQTDHCGGGAMSITYYDATFYGIYFFAGASGSGPYSNIQGNTIQNINWGCRNFAGIFVDAGRVNIGTTNANIIGSNSAGSTGSITVTSITNNSTFWGFRLNGANVNCENNVIASIKINNTNATDATNFYGVHCNSGSYVINVNNNTIGNISTSNSINLSSTSTANAQSCYGVYVANVRNGSSISGNTIANLTNGTTNATAATTGVINGIYCNLASFTIDINNNTIRNLTIANANSSTDQNASVTGIYALTSGSVTGNTIFNLSNTYSAFAGVVQGIYNGGGSPCAKNFVYNLSITGATSTTAAIYGIYAYAGLYGLYYNNIISLGGNTKTTLYGIYDAGIASQYYPMYYNTVYLSGTVASGAINKSYCIYSAANNSNTKDFRNNILYNARSTIGGSNLHYAIYYNYGTSTNLTADYNDYYVSGTGGVLGYFNSTNLSYLPIVTGQDNSSQHVNPNFTTYPPMVAADFYPSSPCYLMGVPISGITTDYLTLSRSASLPTVGALENSNTKGPLEVWQTGGSLLGSYVRLLTAFRAVNNGVHTGSLDVKINTHSVEILSAILNASGTNGGSGTSNYSTVHIYPSAGGLAVNTSNQAGLAVPLIDLNGADNITIDGRVNAAGSTKDLILTNPSSSGTAGTSTIRFINDATNNLVEYCTIKGSSSDGSGGVIFFSTTTGTTGNDNNTIDNNNLTNSANANRPVNVVFSYGTTNKPNNNIVVSNNNVYDFMHRSVNSHGICFTNYTTAASILNNSFYETAAFTATSSTDYSTVIYVYGLTGQLGSDFNINGNYIGGNQPLCAGTWTKLMGTTKNNFYGIVIRGQSGTANNIQGNTIQNISWSDKDVTSGALFTGIEAGGSYVNVGTTTGNIISSIVYTCGGSIYGSFNGIEIVGTTSGDFRNNVISAITLAHTNASMQNNFSGFWIGSMGSNTIQITNNTIGSVSTANSINLTGTSTGNAQGCYGILSNSSGNLTISNNTIANMTNGTTNSTAATTGITYGMYFSSIATGVYNILNNSLHDLKIANANTSTTYPSVSGLYFENVNAKNTVTGNSIYNLSNTYASFAGLITGIDYNGGVVSNSSVCSGNFIHDLSVTGASSIAASVYGIRALTGATTYFNNIISLGGNTKTTLYGFYDAGAASQNCNVYFNTIYINGSLVSGSTNKSYCLYSTANSNTRDFRNNILFNARSTTGGSNLHYSVYYNYSSGTNLTANYNDYYVDGTGGVLGYYGGTKTILPIVTGQDANSYLADPVFINSGSVVTTDYKAKKTLRGVTGTGISADFAGVVRPSVPQMGAWERIGNNWIGTLNTNFGVAGNWAGNFVPLTDDDLIVDPSAINHCILDQDRILGNINNYIQTYNIKNNGNKLTVNRDLILSNGAKIDASFSGSTVQLSGTTAQSISSEAFVDNKVYNLTVNNSNNVILNGTLVLLNTLSSVAGRLDAVTNSPTVVYSGTTAQNIAANTYYNDKIYNLTIDNNVTIADNVSPDCYNLLINSSKTLTTTAGNLGIEGNFTNNGNFNHNNGTVVFNGNGVISGSSNTSFNNVSITGTITGHSTNMNIAGNFTNTGTFNNNNGKVTFNGNTLYDGSSATVFNNVDVAAGKFLTIEGNSKTMRVSNKIRLLASGPSNMAQLVIKDNSSYLTGTGGSDSVIIQVYDTLNVWHYISAPIDSNYMGGMVYKYFFGKLFNETLNRYEWYDGKFPLIAGRGFMIKWNDTYVSPITGLPVRPADRLITIPAKISQLHSGTITYPISKTTGFGDGWNLVGNPYPCSIDLDAAQGWLSTNIDPTTYVYDGRNLHYATYNSNLKLGSNGGTHYIPPQQGLYVHCTANGVWSMDNRVRVAYNVPFWKGNEENQSNPLMNRIFGLMISGNGYTDESMIGFDNLTTSGFDLDFDAYKLQSSEPIVPQINTTTMDGNNIQLAVNFLPMNYNQNAAVPLQFTVGQAGSFTISSKNILFDPSVKVTLEDTKTGKFTDLLLSSYTFSSDAVRNENRFIVHFGDIPTTLDEKHMEDMIKVYSDKDNVVIINKSLSNEKGFVTVYDMLSKEVITHDLTPDSQIKIDMSNYAQSVYLVRIIYGNKTMTQKICINR